MNEKDKQDIKDSQAEAGQNASQVESDFSGEAVNLDKSKIDQVLDSFIREKEQAQERERQRLLNIEKQKRAKKRARVLTLTALALFVLVLIASNPHTIKYYKNYKQAQVPLEEYTIAYNYSPGMKILPMGGNLVMYDSNNLRLLKKDGTEVFDIPFNIGSWDLAASDKAVYLLDKIDNVLYFINERGEFVNKADLNNIPHRLYAGRGGNAALHYKSEAGVEGVVLFDSSGKELGDITYPKTTLTFIHISDDNKTTVHGMLRTSAELENSVYRYSERGSLIFSRSYAGVVFVRQYEDKSSVAFIDVNEVRFYNKNTNEDKESVSSIIPVHLMAFDKANGRIYLLDKRNKLRIIDMEGKILEERHFQTEYKGLVAYKDDLVLIGDDYIRTNTKDIKASRPIEDVFIVGDYLVVVTKGELRLMNKLT